MLQYNVEKHLNGNSKKTFKNIFSYNSNFDLKKYFLIYYNGYSIGDFQQNYVI